MRLVPLNKIKGAADIKWDCVVAEYQYCPVCNGNHLRLGTQSNPLDGESSWRIGSLKCCQGKSSAYFMFQRKGTRYRAALVDGDIIYGWKTPSSFDPALDHAGVVWRDITELVSVNEDGDLIFPSTSGDDCAVVFTTNRQEQFKKLFQRGIAYAIVYDFNRGLEDLKKLTKGDSIMQSYLLETSDAKGALPGGVNVKVGEAWRRYDPKKQRIVESSVGGLPLIVVPSSTVKPGDTIVVEGANGDEYHFVTKVDGDKIHAIDIATGEAIKSVPVTAPQGGVSYRKVLSALDLLGVAFDPDKLSKKQKAQLEAALNSNNKQDLPALLSALIAKNGSKKKLSKKQRKQIALAISSCDALQASILLALLE